QSRGTRRHERIISEGPCGWRMKHGGRIARRRTGTGGPCLARGFAGCRGGAFEVICFFSPRRQGPPSSPRRKFSQIFLASLASSLASLARKILRTTDLWSESPVAELSERDRRQSPRAG